jgi:hypothetical protein
VLSLLAFLAIIPIAIVAGLWAFLPLGVALALLIPWPAHWRAAWEYRGYGMTIAVLQWTYGKVAEDMPDTIAAHFVTAGYYFMCWSRKMPIAELSGYVTAAREGALQQQEPYQQVHAFLVSNQMTVK